MRNDLPRDGVTYIGPRAFAVAFCAVCIALAALFVGLDRFAESSLTVTLDTPAPLAASPLLPPAASATTSTTTPAASTTALATMSAAMVRASMLPRAAVRAALPLPRPKTSTTSGTTMRNGTNVTSGASRTITHNVTNVASEIRTSTQTPRIAAASTAEASPIPPASISRARPLTFASRPASHAHEPALTFSSPGPPVPVAAATARAPLPRILHTASVSRLAVIDQTARMKPSSLVIHAALAKRGSRNNHTAWVRQDASGSAHKPPVLVAAKGLQAADRVNAVQTNLLIPFTPATAARQAPTYAAGAPAGMMVDAKSSLLGNGAIARDAIIIAPLAPKSPAPMPRPTTVP